MKSTYTLLFPWLCNCIILTEKYQKRTSWCWRICKDSFLNPIFLNFFDEIVANIQSFISIDRNGIPSSSLQVCNVRDAVFCDMKQFKGNALQGKKIFFFKLLLYYHAKWAKMHLLCSMYLQQFGYQTMAFLSKFRFF